MSIKEFIMIYVLLSIFLGVMCCMIQWNLSQRSYSSLSVAYRHSSQKTVLSLLIFYLVIGIFLPVIAAPAQSDEASVSQTKVTQPVQVLILSDLIGYIEPCGCTIDLTLGGIQKTIALVKEAQAKGPTLLLVAGSHLFEYPELESAKKAQQVAKAKLIRQLLYEMSVDAFTPGINDKAAGYDFYQSMQHQFPLSDVTINQTGGLAKVIDVGSVKIGVFAVAPPQSTLGLLSSTDQATDPLLSVQSSVDALQAQGADVVIAMSTLPRKDLKELAQKVKSVDFWILGNQPLEEKGLYTIHDTSARLIEAGDRGRHLARLTLHNAKQKGAFANPMGAHQKAIKDLKRSIKLKEKFARGLGGMKARAQIAQLKNDLSLKEKQSVSYPTNQKYLRYELQPITKDLPDDSQVSQQIEAYQSRLKKLNLSAAGEVVPVGKNGNGYAGVSECEMCHPMAVKFWKTTKHAQAWKTLEDANKTYDVDCVSCHVAGFLKPGGSALGHTDKLKDVQCEACHGPSGKHAERGGGEAWTKRSVPATTCQKCHNKHHSPNFNYETYLPKVLGPGHGLPLPETP